MFYLLLLMVHAENGMKANASLEFRLGYGHFPDDVLGSVRRMTNASAL